MPRSTRQPRLDTVRLVETPEGVELALRLCGPPARAGAFALDFLLRSIGYTAASVVLGILGETGVGIFLVVLFFGEWLYPVLFEVLGNGATPGKKAFGVRVVHADGTPVGWRGSLIRNLLRVVDLLPVFYAAGLVTSLCMPSFQRIGDLAAGTVVVHGDPRPRALPAIDEEPRSPMVPLDRDEQRNVLDFAAGTRRWSRARAAELATIASGITVPPGRPAPKGPEAIAALLAVAAWLQGREDHEEGSA